MKNILKFIYLLMRTGKPGKAWFFARWEGAANLQLLKQFINLPGQRIQYVPTEAVFTKQTIPLFGNSLSLLQQCATQYKATEENACLWLRTRHSNQEIKAQMVNHESLLCMHEVFGIHAYQALGTGPCVAIDVGMNIGLASLYLAAMPQVQAVYGFELVGSSTAIARSNIAANPYAAAKVKVQHAGIAAADGFIELPLTGAGDVGAHINMQSNNAAREAVTLYSISTILTAVLQAHPGMPVIIKLDCEGAEYEIISVLKESPLLQHITAFMIEWHVKGSEPITNILAGRGYTCFTPGIEAAQPTGFVYAVKRQLFK